MTLFWFLAAILVIVAMAFIWVPIMRHRRLRQGAVSLEDINVQAYRSRIEELDADYREGRIEEAEYGALKSELERNLLTDTQTESGAETVGGKEGNKHTDWILGAFLSLVVIAVTVGMYWQLGSSQVLAQMEQHRGESERLAKLPPEKRIEALRQLAEQSPQRAELWYALAQGYLQTKNYTEAEDAYNRVLVLVGEDPQVLAEYAQALFFAEGNKMTARVKDLVQRTLTVDPANDTALGLLGIDAFDQERYADAIGYWQQILDGLQDQRDAGAIRAGIERARKLLAQQQGGTDPAATAESAEQQTAALEIDLSLSEALLTKSTPQQAVFVFARAVSGPPMPLAAVRLQVQDLPTQVVLNDAMAMTPQARLSQFEQVEVIARVSQSESVIAAAGDFQGQSGPINLGKAPTKIKIVINNVVE